MTFYESTPSNSSLKNTFTMSLSLNVQDPVATVESASNPSRTSLHSDHPVPTFSDPGRSLFSPGYSPAQPVAAAPSSSLVKGESQSYSGAIMSVPSPNTMSPKKWTVPPPPKAGQKMQPPAYYTATQAVPAQAAQPQTYPTQRSSVSPCSSIGCQLHESTISYSNGIHPASDHSRAQSITEDIRRGSYEHPPGYIQNPYASEMTPEQRFATEQEDQVEQGLPMPSCTHSRKPSTASIIIEESVGNLLKRARRNTEDFVEGVQEWLSETF